MLLQTCTRDSHSWYDMYTHTPPLSTDSDMLSGYLAWGYPRWHVNFNITMLRLVSFSIDYHWACKQIGVADVGHSLSIPSVYGTDAKSSQTGGELNDKKRAAVFHPHSTYTFVNYLSYALYAPLYIAGPILTFNDFMWQVRTALSKSSVVLQAFYDPVISPKRHRAAGDNAIRDSVLYHTAHDGNADPCDARRCDQGCPCMERHDACPAFHDRLLESHLRLAQGIAFNHVTSKWALMITSAAAPLASLPPVGTHGRDGPS